MSKHDGCRMQYHIPAEAWYARQCHRDVPEITLGLYEPGDGSSGEMTIQWLLAGRSAQIQAFNDSWSALAEIERRTAGGFLGGLEELDGTSPGTGQIVVLLRELGFEDATPRENPKAKDEAVQMCETCGQTLAGG